MFAAAENSTLPSPCPLAPALMLSHGPSVAAVHVQSLAAATPIDPDPPCAGSCESADWMVMAQRLIVEGEVTLVALDPQP